MEIGKYRSVKSESLLDRFLDWIGLADNTAAMNNDVVGHYSDHELIMKIISFADRWNADKSLSARERSNKLEILLRQM